MPKPTPSSSPRKPTKRPAPKRKSAPSSRTRKPPHKNPPKPPGSHIGRGFLMLVVAAGLILLGYRLGRPVRQDTPRRATPSSHRSAQTHDAVHPSDLLRYGYEEDAREAAVPEISWYDPLTGTEEPLSAPHSGTQTPSHHAIAHPPSSPATSSPAAPQPTSSDATPERPRLAIIIDDVSQPRQLRALDRLPWHITPSIFPPSELSATSHHLARGREHCMVHLPLQSGSAAMNRMKGMLFVRDGAERVQRRVDEIRRLFPDVRYVNNHTGSVFTADYTAMRRLYSMLRDAGFVFVDSRTTARSTVRRIARSFGDRYIGRDVFIDNVQQVPAILRQLKHAVHIAKKRGYAIAIGHPHKATMEALRQAKEILKGVETVYIDELYP